MKLEIEVPDPPEGWEYTGEFRNVVGLDVYLGSFGVVLYWGNTGESSNKYLILRKSEPPWLPPEGILRSGWVCVDSSNETVHRWWCEKKPTWDEDANRWDIRGPYMYISHIPLNIDWPDLCGEKAIWEVR